MTELLTTADVIADALTQSDIGHIFAYPGDPTIELMERSRARGLDVVLARREGTAAFMAEGYAMARGSLGVCLSTLGPGSTALANGVAAANLDRVPMLAISGQIEASREQFFTHQVVDHKLFFSPITKWAGRIEPSAAGTTMRKAMRLATAERPGAVHLTLAGGAGEQPASDTSFRPLPGRADVQSISVQRAPEARDPIDLIAAAKRPIILAGIGATRAGATFALTGFAETASIPVVVSPMSKGVFPEDHQLFAGVLDMACNQVLWELLRSSDLIIAAGFDAAELIKPWSIDTPVLHVDSLANSDQIYASDVECLGDIGAILDWFSHEWTGQARWSENDVSTHREHLRNSYYRGRVGDHLNPTDVVDVVREAMPADTIATTDVGSHKLLVGQGWRTYAPREMLMTNGLSSMGFGVPAAIGAKLAFPDRPVVAMVGDGGFSMTATEIRLASTLRLPVVFIVFVDGSLNRIELKQMAQDYASTATRIEDMDLVAMAEAMDCDGTRVDSVEALTKALDDAKGLSRPLVVEARVDPSQYESQF